MEDVQNKLQDIRNPMAAMMVLQRELDLETDSDVTERVFTQGKHEVASLPPVVDAEFLDLTCVCASPGGLNLNTRIGLSQLYSSSLSVSLVCQAVAHVAMTRTLLCRDLLILQKLYLRCGDNVLSRHNTNKQKTHPKTPQVLE